MQKSVQVRTPLYAAAYWKQAADEFKNIRVLAFAGMVTALAIILESFPIYLLGQSLKIYFSFVVVSLGCACYGPLVGMGVGAVIDTLGFLLSSYGEPYFPGYLITAMLSGLIYGVMLYQRKPTIPRLIVTRLLINYGSNVLLGSVWKAMLYGKGYLYYLSTGMVKNTIMIPIEVALMWLGRQKNTAWTAATFISADETQIFVQKSYFTAKRLCVLLAERSRNLKIVP